MIKKKELKDETVSIKDIFYALLLLNITKQILINELKLKSNMQMREKIIHIHHVILVHV